MKEIIIVGAGSFGREVLLAIKSINRVNQNWIIKGFIDDNLESLNHVPCDYKIIGTIRDWIPKDHEVFALGIASPQGKEKVVGILKSKGAQFEQIISTGVSLGDYVRIGEGCVILGFTVGSNVTLGNFTSIMGSMIGQDSILGDFSTTTGYVNVASATLGKRVFVGSHSVILNDRVVGDDAFVCVGSVVIRNVKPGTKVFGNPARRVDI